jgi:hypothetical protein
VNVSIANQVGVRDQAGTAANRYQAGTAANRDQAGTVANQVQAVEPAREQGDRRGVSERPETKKYTVAQLLELARQKTFIQQEFDFGDYKKLYTPVTHFFESDTKFAKRPTTKIKFTFKIERTHAIHCYVGTFTNLNSHLMKHPESAEW